MNNINSVNILQKWMETIGLLYEGKNKDKLKGAFVIDLPVFVAHRSAATGKKCLLLCV